MTTTTDRSVLFAQARAEGRVYVGTLADGIPVFTKKGVSHLTAHADVIPLLPEAFAQVSMADFRGRDALKTVDLRRGTIGTTSLVSVNSGETIVYRRRKGRKDGCSKFVMGRESAPCSTVFICLYLADETTGLVAVMTAYIGSQTAPEPNSPSGRKDVATWEKAKDGWADVALVYDGDVEEGEYTEADFLGVSP